MRFNKIGRFGLGVALGMALSAISHAVAGDATRSLSCLFITLSTLSVTMWIGREPQA